MDADVNAERTYAVVAIKKQDGSPMPAVSDGDYGKPPFFVSPLIHGQEPWRYNIASMGGGAATTVIDGVMYRLIECDSIEMFADRGLSLIVSTTDFFDKAAFNYDEATGLVSPNESFDGVNLVFNLPIDPAKADAAKAEQYLKDLWADDSTDGDSADRTDGRSEDGNAEGERFAAMFDAIDWDKATVIESTVKKLTADKDGYVTYDYNTDEYGSGTITLLLSQHFAADQTSVSEVVSGGASDENIYGIRISIDAEGGITGAVVVPAA